MLNTRSHLPFFHRAVHWVARIMNSIPLCPSLLKEQSPSCAPSPVLKSQARCWSLQWLLRFMFHLWECVGHHLWGIVALGVYMLVVMNLYPCLHSLLLSDNPAMLITSVFWVHQNKQSFYTLPQKTGESDHHLFSLLSSGRHHGLEYLSWVWVLSAWSSSDASKVTLLFFPFQRGWTSQLDARVLIQVSLSVDGFHISVSMRQCWLELPILSLYG